MITGGSTLDPGFPTWGTMLREHGYHTRWYGKWHLTHRDNQWTAPTRAPARWSATGSPAAPTPRPTARPGRAGAWTRRSPASSTQWFAHEGGAEPVVHDGVVRQPARHRLVVRVERPRAGRGWARRASRAALPPNFETPELLVARDKPRLQRSLQDTAAASFGPVPFDGAEAGPDVAGVHRPLREAPARGRRPHRRASCSRWRAAREIAANTVIAVHLRPRRVRRLARAARQGRERLRGGASACR